MTQFNPGKGGFVKGKWVKAQPAVPASAIRPAAAPEAAATPTTTKAPRRPAASFAHLSEAGPALQAALARPKPAKAKAPTAGERLVAALSPARRLEQPTGGHDEPNDRADRLVAAARRVGR